MIGTQKVSTRSPSSLQSKQPKARIDRAANVPRARPNARKDASPEGSPSEGTGLGLKAVWYGAEQFGNLVGLTKSKAKQQASLEPPARQSLPSGTQMSVEEAVEAIRRDYDANYFISGQGDMAAYDSECVFADPFVSFRGVQRFKNNVSNLGGLMSEVSLEVFDWKLEGSRLVTRWRFSCILDLPWHPRLAAAGGTTHVIDEASGRVVEHIERWDIEPGKVLQQLLKPAGKLPTNFWEAMFLAVADKDGPGVWFLLTPTVWKVAALALAADVGCKVATGSGVPGVDGQEWVYVGAVVAALITEVLKFSRGM